MVPQIKGLKICFKMVVIGLKEELTMSNDRVEWIMGKQNQ